MKKGLSFSRMGSDSRPGMGSFHKKPGVADVVAKKRLGEEMIARVNDLPSLPTVVMKVIELINDDSSNAENFEKHLRQDQALTARLLKIVNSSFFGLRQKINSISQAIVMIGYNSLKNLVLAASTNKLLEGSFPGYGFKESGMWQHSFMCATWSKKIAKQLGMSTEQSEGLFIAGLLHDVGKLILTGHITHNCKEMLAQLVIEGGVVCKAERTLIGIDHPEIGSRIAQKWNFPSKLANIIKYHHNVSSAIADQEEISVIHLVNHMLNVGKFGMYDNFPITSELSEACYKHLKIDDAKISIFQEQINESAKNWQETQS